MARPADLEKRHTLARAAVEILREEGIDTPMARVAERLNLKRPTFLYYFPDRASIAAVGMEELLTAQARYVLPLMAAHEHPLDQIHALLRGIHAFHRGHEDRLLFLAMLAASTDRERAQAILRRSESVFEEEWAALTERLAAAVRAGSVRPCDPHALVSMVRCINDGMFMQRMIANIDPEPMYQFLWEHVLLSLKVIEP